MKKTLLAVSVTATLLVLTSCQKIDCKSKNPEPDCDLIPAKIIRYDCDRVILELVTDEKIGDANWTDTQTSETYQNVVSFYNTCAISELTNGNKETVYVNVKKTGESLRANDCVQCQAISEDAPKTQVDFTAIKKGPCVTNTKPNNINLK